MPNPATIRVEGLASSYAAGTFIAAHTHAAHQIVHAITGVMRVRADDATWVVPAGRGLWVPAQMPHEIRCIGLVEMRTVYLSGEPPSVHPTVQVIGITPLLREIIVRLAEGSHRRQIPHLTALLVDEIVTMDVEPFRLPAAKDTRIAGLVSHLSDNPEDQTSLGIWANRLGFSERNLIRSIRAETGMSFREVRRQARVMAAIEQLALGDPVTRVALNVGFESPSAFAHAFRLITGATPRQYMSR